MLESTKADQENFGNSYGIYHRKIGEAEHDSDSSE